MKIGLILSTCRFNLCMTPVTCPAILLVCYLIFSNCLFGISSSRYSFNRLRCNNQYRISISMTKIKVFFYSVSYVLWVAHAFDPTHSPCCKSRFLFDIFKLTLRYWFQELCIHVTALIDYTLYNE